MHPTFLPPKDSLLGVKNSCYKGLLRKNLLFKNVGRFIKVQKTSTKNNLWKMLFVFSKKNDVKTDEKI